MKSKILGLLTVGLLAGPMCANANIITFDFTTTVGNGYFSYDDANTTVLPRTVCSGTMYAATAYVFDGVDYGSSGFICLFDNFDNIHDDVSDDLAVGNLGGNLQQPRLFLASTSSDPLSGDALADLNDMTLADWDRGRDAYNALNVRGTITSLVRREVPEPGSLALLGLGLLGLGVVRRRAA